MMLRTASMPLTQCLAALLFSLLAGPAAAQAPAAPASTPAVAPPPVAKVEVKELIPAHPWVVPAPSLEPLAYFTNIEDGAKRDSPFVVRFGLSMRGVVPAGQVAGTAGHHHLLIDQPLPLDFKKPIPFTEHYKHFGQGQMESVVDLPPGRHTLRLLLADQAHIPFFVYSKPITITVEKQNKGVKPEAVTGPPHIEVLSPADGATVNAPFRIQFHASGYDISHAAPRLSDTGHFRLTLERTGPNQKPEVIEFDGGQTEAWLKPPKGSYSVRLDLVSNTDANKLVAHAKPLNLTVP